MPKKNDYETQIQNVIENAVEEVRRILNQQIQDQFAEFIANRPTTATRKKGPGSTPASKKKTAPKKRRKSTRVRSEDVATAALEFLKEASGPVSINEISEATGYPLEKLRRALGVLHAGKKISKNGVARSTRYAIGGGGKPNKKAVTSKKKAAPKRKAAPKKKGVTKKKTSPKKKVAPKKKAAPKKKGVTKKKVAPKKKTPPKK